VTTLDEALAAMKEMDEKRRGEGFAFLANAKPQADKAREVAAALVPFIRDFRSANAAASIAGRWPFPEMVAEMINLAETDTSVFARRAAIRALGAYDDEKAATCLIGLIDNVHLQRDALANLRKAGKKAEKPLVALMHHKNRTVRDEVGKLLDEIKASEELLREQSVKSLSSTEQETKLSAVAWLGAHKPDAANAEQMEEASKALEPMLKDMRADVKKAAASAMEHWAVKASVPTLVELLEKGSLDDLKPIIAAVGRLKDDRASKWLMLRLGNLMERDAITQALIAIGPSAEELVHIQLRNRDVATVTAAVKILSEIGTEKSLKVLSPRRKTAPPVLAADIAVAMSKIRARIKKPTSPAPRP
jgi:HEAT repeat protein